MSYDRNDFAQWREHMRDAVCAAAFVHFAAEHHRMTGEWPTGEDAARVSEAACGLADIFDETMEPKG